MENYKNLSKIIDNEEIPIIVYNDLNKNYKIVKENNNKNIETTSFIKEDRIIKYILKNQIGKKRILDFIKILNTNLSHCNFENFIKNIKTLRIYYKKPSIKEENTSAEYLSYHNIINIFNKKELGTIYHELLHMSSNKVINKNLILTGLSITDFIKLEKYGTFITEGYTEYLNTQYFSKDVDVYTTQINIVKFLEKIIEKDLMEKMYFNADLRGLINELIKYRNKDETLKFIVNTDIIHKYLWSLNPIKRLKLKKACIEVNNYLIKSYYKKLKLNYNQEEISKYLEDFLNELNEIYIGFVPNEYYIKKL